MLVLHDHAPAMQGCISPKPRLVHCGLFSPSLHIHPARFCLVSSIGVCFSAADVGCGPSCWPRCIMSVISGISRVLGEVRSCRAGEGLKMPVQRCWKEVAESRPEAPPIVGRHLLSGCPSSGPWMEVGGRRTPPELLAPATNASMSSRLFFFVPLRHCTPVAQRANQAPPEMGAARATLELVGGRGMQNCDKLKLHVGWSRIHPSPDKPAAKDQSKIYPSLLHHLFPNSVALGQLRHSRSRPRAWARPRRCAAVPSTRCLQSSSVPAGPLSRRDRVQPPEPGAQKTRQRLVTATDRPPTHFSR